MAAAPSRGPLARYLNAKTQGGLHSDLGQVAAAESLQQLYSQLTQAPTRRWWSRRGLTTVFTGRYLHGPVGRGKTLLMDMMATELTAAGVGLKRLHFQDFMLQVHARLAALDGQRDPLQRIAEEMAGTFKVLCFDEFQVNDIGDAMVLGELLSGLFARQVCLIATSNVAPDDLYAGGLQRARFLPAIDALKRHCQVIDIGDGHDYRLRALSRQALYHHPLGEHATAALQSVFEQLATDPQHGSLRIQGRSVDTVRHAQTVAWFSFQALCQTERSAADYLELCQRFDTLLVDGVPRLGNDDNNAVRRFIQLVDACYDRGVKLVVAADAAVDQLYQGRLSEVFARTQSRLIEMQSDDYLARPVRRELTPA
jgi:cell division protein ZapE